MLDLGFSRQLHRIGFRQRATLHDDRVIYRLADGGGHVRLSPDEWHAVSKHYDSESGRVVRTAIKMAIGLFPGIFIFGMTIGQILPGAGLVILLGIVLGPLAIYLWHSHRIRRIVVAIDAELTQLPRTAAPTTNGAPKPPHWLEIAFLVLVGPHLFAQVVGTFFPDVFRNTPWSGSRLDWTGIAGFLVLGAIIYLRWRSLPLARAKMPAEGRQEQPEGRRVDVVARARENA